MADVDINLDSSDIPLILDALQLLRASLDGRDEEADGGANHPALAQIDLLINTFETISA